jgi:serine/threonine-protein kinase
VGSSPTTASGDGTEVIDQLAEEFLERCRGGERPSVEEYAARHPALADQIREFFSALVLIEGLKPNANDPHGESPLLQEHEAPERLGEFRVLGELGRGGMGVVYEAEQESLGRRVALKVLPAGTPAEGARVRRFLLEAEVNSHLEHPGIVPVHDLRRDDQGRPFYVMRLVRGETLGSAIDRFHREAGGPESRPMELRHLLRRFIDACNAVAYAHDKGVLHRDIKPENILLGPFGETLVVDWGLAKAFGQDDPQLAPDDQTFRSMIEGDDTMPGQVMGTPRYMSPEQAAGRTGAVGPASDVYSLGASLYYLIVGRSAFVESDLSTLLNRVKRGQFPPPDQVRHGVPRSLEAICLKAMALRPRERYSTPLALAEDLERWLADEPITARAEPLLTRMGRWARRHRIWVATASVLLLTATIASTVGALLLDRERARTRRQRDEATIQSFRAEASFRRAREAVDRYLTRVSEDRLLNTPGLQPLRRELLEDALEYYREFTALRGDSLDLRVDLAASQLRVGEITYAIDRLTDARAELDEARRLYEALVTVRPATRRDLLRCYRGLGKIDLDLRKLDEARGWLDQADTLARALQGEHPDDLVLKHDLARVLIDRAEYEKRSAQQPKALATLTEAVERLDEIVRKEPSQALYRYDLAEARLSRGVLLRELENFPKSLAELELATHAFEDLTRRHPDAAEYRFRLAFSESQWATTLRWIGSFEPSLIHFRVAEAIMGALVAANPRVHAYREELAGVHNNLGNLLRAMGRREEAIQAHRRAEALREAIYSANPEKIRERSALTASRSAIALLQFEAGRHDEAIATLRQTLDFYRKVLEARPDDADARGHLGSTLGNMGHTEADRGRLDEAVELYRESIANFKAYRDAEPTSESIRRRLGQHLAAYARVLWRSGQEDQAIAVTHELRTVGRGDPKLLREAASLLALAASASGGRSLSDEAVATLREAVAAGWTDGASLLSDPDLAAIRDRPDFQRIIAPLLDEALPADPFAH